jgi:hyperosmotically inducible periplasmic protein
MKSFYHRFSASLLFVSLLVAAMGFAQDATQPDPVAPDNTKVNQRDRSTAEATADQQKENRSDREITQQIRKALVEDKSLSTYAHNVKVITRDGLVTLKGPVQSATEKLTVETKATAVAGESKVTSELAIKQH